MHFKSKDLDKLKEKGWKNIQKAKPEPMEAEMALLVAVQIQFKARTIEQR